MKTGRWKLILLLCFVTAALAGCEKRQEAADTLVLYAAGPRDLAEWMCEEFEKETGCHTRLFSATTGEIMAKLQAEEFKPQADVVILASPTAAEALKSQQMLAPLPKDISVREDWKDRDGYYAGTAASALGIAMRRDNYNPSLEWADIFSGAYKGTMIMPSPDQSGTSAEFVIAFDLAMGEKFWDGLKAAKKHGLQISGPNSQALTGLILHSHDAVLAAADYLVFREIEKGEPLVMVFPASGCPVIPRPVAILKDAHNLKAAEEFVRFCLSPKVQERIAAGHLIPADPNVPLSPQRRAMAHVTALPFDVGVAMKEQRSALQRFEYEIEKGGQ